MGACGRAPPPRAARRPPAAPRRPAAPQAAAGFRRYFPCADVVSALLWAAVAAAVATDPGTDLRAAQGHQLINPAQPAMPRGGAATTDTPLLAACYCRHNSSPLPTSSWTAEQRAMQLFAKTSTGRTIQLHVKGSDDIARVKALIQAQEGIPPDQQSIYSDRGQLLEDWQTLSGCSIQAESQLQLRLGGEVAPPVGGTSRRRHGAIAAVVVVAVALCVVIGACIGSGGGSTGCPCKNNGTCITNGGEHHCRCASGWSGDKDCAHAAGCDDSPCKNGGTCFTNGGEHHCRCASGWSGDKDCAHATGCDDSPCKNGGTCIANGGEHHCRCASGWSGEQDCEHAIGCDDRPCGVHGSCVAQGGNYTCGKCQDVDKKFWVDRQWIGEHKYRGSRCELNPCCGRDIGCCAGSGCSCSSGCCNNQFNGQCDRSC
jgi:hypothetical protein